MSTSGSRGVDFAVRGRRLGLLSVSIGYNQFTATATYLSNTKYHYTPLSIIYSNHHLLVECHICIITQKQKYDFKKRQLSVSVSYLLSCDMTLFLLLPSIYV